MVNQVGEVGHGFFAFVYGGGELCGGEVGGYVCEVGWVDDVDGTLPGGEVFCHPGHVVGG